ncbi:MAG: xanthine dehydrogenase family protein molybdopterin-binding subunit [Chromatiales bacterium]
MSATVENGRGRGLTRRRFLIGTAVLAGGGLALTWATREKDSLRASPDILEPNAFLQITPDGKIIFQLDKVEMGQGTMTGLATLVAEELDVDPARFTVQFAPVLSTFQRPIQMTGQSRSMTDSWDVLRETGAAARAMLLEAAAARWGVATSDLQTDDGEVVRPGTGERLSYAVLAADAAKLSPPWRVKLKQPADYRWIGQHVPRLDTRVKVTGEAIYGIDVQLEGMLTAVVARCPELGATLTRFDAADAEGMPGVRGLVPLVHGVAVVADDFWAAHSAARKIRLEWEAGSLANKTDAALLEEQRAQLARADEGAEYSQYDGDTETPLNAAANVLEAEYTTPYLAHAPMEPLNATAHVREGGCEIWAPTQGPDMVRQIACDILALPRAAVNVHTTYIGGGFGRRFMWDFIDEAVRVARHFDVPVKLVWTREDDIGGGYFRQLTVHRVRGALSADGAIEAWEHRQAVAPTGELLTPPTMSTLLPEALSVERRAAIGQWLGRKSVEWMGAFQAREGAVTVPYDINNRSFIQFVNDPGVPISIWRSVGNSYNAFVVESFIDELAASAGADPLQFRRDRLSEHPRHLAVIDALAKQTGWKGPALGDGDEDGRYRGVAVYESFGSVVGQIAEVSVDGRNRIRVHKVCCVVDCGLAVTPDIVKQQMESGIIFGLTAALYGEINIDNGQVRQSNYHDYRMLRLHDAPDIEVSIIESSEEPAGVGEPATAVIAPAVANAVFAATGRRLRSLPLKL